MRHHSIKNYGPVNAMFPALIIMALHVDKFSAPAALPLMKCREIQGWSECSGGRETNCWSCPCLESNFDLSSHSQSLTCWTIPARFRDEIVIRYELLHSLWMNGFHLNILYRTVTSSSERVKKAVPIVLMRVTPIVLIEYVTMKQSVCTQNATCFGWTNGWWWLFRTAETGSFLDLCIEGLFHCYVLGHTGWFRRNLQYFRKW